jgi:hypothetical protein
MRMLYNTHREQEDQKIQVLGDIMRMNRSYFAGGEPHFIVQQTNKKKPD